MGPFHRLLHPLAVLSCQHEFRPRPSMSTSDSIPAILADESKQGGIPW
ncbi:hypothetical protein BURPS305_2659 [Burkholderia pseudomallei 305]|nr:hypothetical protein BURPS305_2659 [Burkholderia pseudomallei 305]